MRDLKGAINAPAESESGAADLAKLARSGDLTPERVPQLPVERATPSSPCSAPEKGSSRANAWLHAAKMLQHLFADHASDVAASSVLQQAQPPREWPARQL